MSERTLSLGADTSGSAWPFDRIGDTVTGVIIDMAERQQTDLDTGLPAVWADGKPKMMVVVELEVDGEPAPRTVFLRGSQKAESCSSLAAVIGAVKAATGKNDLRLGDTLTLTYIADGEASKRGWNPPKRYSAKYTPKGISLGTHAEPGDAAAIALMSHPQYKTLQAAGLDDAQIRAALNVPPF